MLAAAVGAARSMLRNHRRKVFFTSLLALSAYYLYRKVWPMVKRYWPYLKMAYSMRSALRGTGGSSSAPRQTPDQRRKLGEAVFEKSFKTMSKDIALLHPHLKREVGLSEVEPFREKEEHARATSKAAQKSLWELLKVVAVTYAVAGMYTVVLHDLVKRMQSTILVRHNFEDSRPQLDAEAKEVERERERQFLKITNVPASLTGQGSASAGHLVQVRQAVDLVLGPVKLSKAFSRQNIARFLSDVRQHVEAPGESSSGTSNLVERFVLPPEASEGERESLLLCELRDWASEENPDFLPVLKARLDAGFKYLEQKIVWQAFGSEGSEATKPLAKLLAPTKAVAFAMFDKEPERQDVLSSINRTESNQQFFEFGIQED